MEYTVSTDNDRLDIDLIHEFLSKESYWARNIPRDLVERSIRNSFCVGAFHGERQVGFARVVTDWAVFAYVADVFVVGAHRGRGVSKLLMQAIRNHPDLQVVRRWSLVTTDAHGLYRQFGFRDVENPEKYMEIVRKNPYG